MELEYKLPKDIEKRSFEIIEKELSKPLDPILAPVIKRVIHTTADFDYAKILCFSENVIDIALKAIKNGVNIVTDTNMGKAGINQKLLKQFGGEVYCFMGKREVAEEACKRETTRAVISMEKALSLEKPLIFAIGNAPTALLKLYDMILANEIQPALIIGVPVGFVNVEVSKEKIMSTNIPYIVAKGRKGGSTVAAAICNALLYQLKEL